MRCLPEPFYVVLATAHNTLLSSAPGMSPLQSLYGYQPLLFPSQEQDLEIPSVQTHMRLCHCMWRRARADLLKTVGWY